MAQHNDRINILLVDDRPDGLLTLEAVLKRSDFNLVKASSGLEAFARLKENNFALILLDVQMPGLDGFQTAQLIKQEVLLREIPIIFVTAISKEEKFVYQGYDVGAVDYIFKPFDPQILQSKVNVFVDLFRKQLKIKQQAEMIRESERAEAERQLALEASKARSDFFAGMSHDIRTPMNCIVGMAELLSETQLSEEQANYVNILKKASENLLDLVNNILDLSKIESGKFEIERRPFDLFEAMESLLDINAPRAHSKGLELVLKIAPDVPRFIEGDSSRTKQILINLLGNAIKFTNSGEIILSINSLGEDNEKIHLQFSVKDSGIGMAAEDVPTAFDHFSQGRRDLKTKSEGSGLGLSICKRLSQLMDGTIRVESTVGQGSTFSIEIPFKKYFSQSENQQHPSVDLKNRNVLVIDDNAAVCAALSESFVLWGAGVRSASNLDEALQLINSAKSNGTSFDFIFVDIRIPGIASGGLDILERLKSEINNAHLITMMLPTNHRHGDLESLRAAGISNYLIKPIKPQALCNAVSGIVSDKLKALPEKIKSSMKPLRILVADDSDDNRFLIEMYLSSTPFIVEMAENGHVALEKFKKDSYDIVLMDLQMPIMDGFAALAAIRDWENKMGKTKTPIVALTAFALKEDSEKSLAAGFKAHITKPIKKSNLISAVLGNAA